MSGPNKLALFIYSLPPTSTPSTIEATRPVPHFLTEPVPSQHHSQQWWQAFIDVLSIVNTEFQPQLITALGPTTPCIICDKPATDCLKQPTSFLHLPEPTMMVQVTPICERSACEEQAKAQLQAGMVQKQNQVNESGKTLFGNMDCEICGQEGAKRCAGCGNVAYCGKECQKAGWKKHKRWCRRKRTDNDQDVPDPEILGFDAI